MTRHILLALTVLTPAGLLTGCDDLETTGSFRLEAADGTSRTWLIPDAENVGGGPANLGSVSSSVAAAWFALGEERSAYLFDGNLAAGIETGGFFALPAYNAAGPIVDSGGFAYNVIEPDRPSYESFRVYDSGACSVNLGWTTPVLAPLVPAFSPRVAAAIDRELARCEEPDTARFTRLTAASLLPVFRARSGGGAGALGIDDDLIRYSARYQAPSLGGCAPTTVDISFEFGFREGPEGEVVGFIEPQTIAVEVVDFCIAESTIEDAIRDRLASSVPTAIAASVRDGTRLNPTAIGLAATSCAEDSECETAYPGTGHMCTDEGTCEVQLNVDRVNVRPEGVELILTEFDTDPQRPLIGVGLLGGFFEGIACGPDRNNGMLAVEPTTGTLTSYSVPVGASAAAICM